MKNKTSAFSLLELVIVIVIIGLLAIGITGVKSMIGKGRLSKARILTQSSPVLAIDGISLWLEATNFDFIVKDENNKVNEWKDASGQGNNVSQEVSDNQPSLIKNDDGIYVVDFDGDELSKRLVGNKLFSPKELTIIVVNESDTAPSRPLLWGSVDNIVRIQNPWTDGSVIFDAPYIGGRINVAGYIDKLGEFHIWTFEKNPNGTSYIYLDGTEIHSGTWTTDIDVNPEKNLIIGGSFNGKIAELIIYKKALNSEERGEVEKYLSDKFGIELD